MIVLLFVTRQLAPDGDLHLVLSFDPRPRPSRALVTNEYYMYTFVCIGRHCPYYIWYGSHVYMYV